jgi:hypothetical protein
MIVVVEWKYEMVAEIDTRARDKVSTAGRMGSRNRADPLFFFVSVSISDVSCLLWMRSGVRGLIQRVRSIVVPGPLV